MENFSDFTIFELPWFLSYLDSQQEFWILPLPSPSETCVLPFNFTLERDPKYIFYCQHDVGNIQTRSSIFYYMIDMSIYTQNLWACYSGQYVYVMGLLHFFFVPQDLIDRFNSYFHRIAFRRNLLLLGFQHCMPQVFSDENKLLSLKWCCINL